MQKELGIVSLGPGKIEQLTIEAKKVLLKSKKIYCRFPNPLLEYFSQKHKKVIIFFQSFYNNPKLVQGINRKRLYKKIAELVVNEALNNEGIVYALPGSAFIAEDTTYLIYKVAKAKGLRVNTILGTSFIDVLLSSLPEKYKKNIYPQRIFTVANLGIPFNGYFSYIIAQSDDLVQRYKPNEIEKILSKHYPKDFKFLYIYPNEDYKNFSYEVKVIEFQAKDIEKMIDIFKERSGSIFIPARLIDYERSYKKQFDALPRHKSKDPSFLADLKFQESQAFFKLKRYGEALASAQEALRMDPDSERRGIHFLIGVCLEKCKRYQEAILELKKAEKEAPEIAEINYVLGKCYKNFGQIDKYLQEIEVTFRKRENIASKKLP
ncbi:tetratricopeptide repeat protein [bacterium]|nr:tetratricopeptide repeat protein [bacterium]